MKLSVACAIVAAVLSASQVDALKAYLAKIPNGSSFTQELGHPGDDSSKYTDFATAFEAASLTWDSTFCKAAFKTTDTTISMTNGEAFGDPCCTWKAGAKPDFAVTAFTISPTKKTVCASSSSTTPAATTATPKSTTATPTSTTATPKTTSATPTATTSAPSNSTSSTPMATTATPTTSTTTPTSTSKSKKHKDKKHKDKKHKDKKHKDKKHKQTGDDTPAASSNAASTSSGTGTQSSKCNVSRR